VYLNENLGRFFLLTVGNSAETSLVHVAIILTVQGSRAATDRNPPAERSDSQSAFFFTFRKIDSILVVTSRVIRLPWSILASACRSNGRCAIERSSSRKPSLTEFRVRDARATSVPPHITTAIATDAHCQRPSGRLDQYFPVLRLVYRFDYSHETGRHSRFYYREKGKEENAFALEISRYRNRSCRVFFLDFSVSSFSPGARTYM